MPAPILGRGLNAASREATDRMARRRREPREPDEREQRLAIQIARSLTRGTAHAVTLRLGADGRLVGKPEMPEWSDAAHVET